MKNYDFVKRWAFKPKYEDPDVFDEQSDTREPIDLEIFQKMVFCDEIFCFMSFEETLFFTGLDVDLNSFKKDDLIDQNELLKISE